MAQGHHIINSRAPKIKQPSGDLAGPLLSYGTSSAGLSFPSWRGRRPSGSSLPFPSWLLLLQAPGFPCSAALAGLAGLSPVLLWLLDLLQRDALLAMLLSTAEASSFAQFLAELVRTEKVGRGQLAGATEIAHDSPRSRGKVCTQDHCLPSSFID